MLMGLVVVYLMIRITKRKVNEVTTREWMGYKDSKLKKTFKAIGVFFFAVLVFFLIAVMVISANRKENYMQCTYDAISMEDIRKCQLEYPVGSKSKQG